MILQENMERIPSPWNILVKSIPELLYWVCKDKELKFVAEDIVAEVHQHPFSQAERQIYIESLIAGVTGRSKKVILMEMDHILREVYDEDKRNLLLCYL